MKSLTNPKVFLVTLFGKPVPAFRHPLFRKPAACDLENDSEQEKIFQRQRKKARPEFLKVL
jgi:hypothetical protein